MSLSRLRPLVVLLGLLAPACHKDPPSTESSGAKESPAPSAETKAGDPGRASEFHEATFDITVRTQGTYAVGKESSFDIIVVPKGGYHTNDKYPYKLKLEPADGVKFPADTVTRDAVTLEPMKATMKVTVTPTASGQKEVGGQLSFSVCSAENCLVEKRSVVTTLKVD